MREEGDVNRVWLAFKGNKPTREEIEAAVRLAESLSAELHGLLLRDDDLLALAELPFAVELTATGRRRDLSRRHLARSLRVMSDSIQEMMRQATSGAALQWSFDAEHRALDQMLEALRETEVMILTGTQHRPPLGRPTRSRPLAPVPSVMAVFDDSPSTLRGLRLAAGLAMRERVPLVVCMIVADIESEHRLQDRVRELLAESLLEVRYRSMKRLDAESLARIRREESARQVVIGLDEPLDNAKLLCDKAPCSLILVR